MLSSQLNIIRRSSYDKEKKENSEKVDWNLNIDPLAFLWPLFVPSGVQLMWLALKAVDTATEVARGDFVLTVIPMNSQEVLSNLKGLAKK